MNTTRTGASRQHLQNAAALLLLLLPCLCFAEPPTQGTAPSLDEVRARWRAVPRDDLLKAAGSGKAEAQCFLGVTEWEQAFADSDRAYLWLTSSHTNRPALSKTDQQASSAKWSSAPEAELRRAAEAGDSSAQWFLGRLETDRASARARAAFDWLKQAARQSLGCASAEVALRYLGQMGWRVIPPDPKEGLRWLRLAAGQGVEAAEHRLADIFLEGALLPYDVGQAVDYLQKAAGQGCPRAQYELARQYVNGNGEPRNADELPAALLKKSAASNYTLAQHALAEHYRNGLGVPKDYQAAIHYYLAAYEADLNHPDSSESGAAVVFDLVDQNLDPGFPLNVDFIGFAEVFSAYLKATQKRDPAAMYRIGKWYLAGQFVPPDPVQAYYWFDRAATDGHPDAASERARLKSTLSPDQLQQASKPAFEAPQALRLPDSSSVFPTSMPVFPISPPRSLPKSGSP